jgi:hypothetical protein
MAGQIRLAGPGSHVDIAVLDYERAERCEDEPDWLSCEVRCAVASFGAALSIPLATEDLARFRDSLAGLLTHLAGSARMDTIEERIRLVVEMGARGAAVVSGAVSSHSGPDATLSFRFETDQSYLGQTLSEMEATLKLFPERPPSRGAAR